MHELVFCLAVCTNSAFVCRGTPGVDWDLDSTDKSVISQVYYNTYDARQDPDAGLLTSLDVDYFRV